MLVQDADHLERGALDDRVVDIPAFSARGDERRLA
jgi:hypothetical protein